MKKLLSALSAGMLGLSALTMTNVAAETIFPDVTEENYQYADFNNDGNIDVVDVYYVLVYYAESSVDHLIDDNPGYTDEIRANIKEHGDLNGDGMINAIDCVGLFQAIEAHGGVTDLDGDGLVTMKDAEYLLENDFDNNGVVDSYDVQYLAAYLKADDEQFAVCDFNNDGLVNGEDVYYIYGRFIQLAVDYEDSKAAVAEKYALSDDIIAAVDTLGDVYEDDLINGADAVELWTYINDNNDPGDVNCDGVIDARDASVVLTYYSQQSAAVGYVDNITMERFMADVLGDYDGNGVVDARDASALLTQYAKNSVQ